MKPTVDLAHRFREVILNGKWIANTNFKDQLSNLDWEIAVKKVGTLNTIADLAQHIHYYIDGINNVLKGGSLDIRDKYSFDFPVIGSQAQWEQFLNKFWKDAENFASLVEGYPINELDSFFTDDKYGTYHRNLEGMIEHCYYHLGQIVLIKKLLMNPLLYI